MAILESSNKFYSNETQDYYDTRKDAEKAEDELWWEEHDRAEEEDEYYYSY